MRAATRRPCFRVSLPLLLVLAGCAHFVPLPPQAELHRAKTMDGWEIALVRYRPEGIPSGLPVILVPGISANA